MKAIFQPFFAIATNCDFEFFCAAFFSSFSKPPPSFTFFDFFFLFLLSSVAYDKRREWRKNIQFPFTMRRMKRKKLFQIRKHWKNTQIPFEINLRRFFNPFFLMLLLYILCIIFFSPFLMSKSNQFVYMLTTRTSLEKWNEWQKKKRKHLNTTL